MRVIAGTRKGHRLASPKGAHVRPTGDRVREAIFNLVGPVDDTSVLDLFAGSGALGIEALSRGARRCLFAESDRGAVRVIRENIERTRLTGAVVEQRDAIAVLREEHSRRRSHDLILCDPPYGRWAELEAPLAEILPGVLAPDGLLVVETDERVEPQLPLDRMTSRRYGSARVTIFRHARGTELSPARTDLVGAQDAVHTWKPPAIEAGVFHPPLCGGLPASSAQEHAETR